MLRDVEADEIAVTGFVALVVEPDAALSDEALLHAPAASAAIASTPRNLVIGSKDRGGAEAPRLLFIRESIGRIRCQHFNEYDRAPPRR
jgi:hypothetical protein